MFISKTADANDSAVHNNIIDSIIIVLITFTDVDGSSFTLSMQFHEYFKKLQPAGNKRA